MDPETSIAFFLPARIALLVQLEADQLVGAVWLKLCSILCMCQSVDPHPVFLKLRSVLDHLTTLAVPTYLLYSAV